MHDKLLYFIHDEQGGTAAEYAIMASLIAAVVVAVVTALGLAVNSLFSTAVEDNGNL